MSIYDSLAPHPRGARVAGMCLQKHAHAHADTHVHAQVRAHAINSYPLTVQYFVMKLSNGHGITA